MLHDILDTAARSRPELRLADDYREITVTELVQESCHAAGVLADRGVGAGDRVAVIMENRLDIGVVTFAASRLRAATAVLPPEAPTDRLAALLRDLAPKAVVVTTKAAEELTGFPLLDPIDLSSTPTGGPRTFGGRGQADDTVLLLHTSGSTALPKAVVCPQSSVCFAVEAIATRLGYTSSDRVYCGLAMSFDYGLYQLFLALAGGSDLVIGQPGSPNDLAAIDDRECTVVPILPSFARRLMLQSTRTGRRGDRVRMVTNTGDVLGRQERAGLREVFPQAKLVLMFGQTECKRIAISDPDDDIAFPGAAGIALPGTWISVVDELGDPVPAGTVGELTVSGPHVMAGYWNDPAASAKRFTESSGGCRTLHTGDYVHLDESGRIYFHGRRDGELKIRGIRMSSAEIEEAATALPNVRAAAIVAPRGISPATLFVEGPVEPTDVFRGLGQQLGAARVPTAVVTVPSMPINDRGKWDRQRLKSMAEREHIRRTAARLGTPLFLYDSDEIQRAHDVLSGALPDPHTLYYSVKANPNPAIVGGLLDAGCRIEVSSLGELRLALSETNDPDKVLYTGPGKLFSIPIALDAGCRWFSIESPSELAALDQAAGHRHVHAKAILRVNLPTSLKGARLPISGGPSKFGMDVPVARKAASSHTEMVSIVGLHFFPAGDVTTPGALLEMFLEEIRVASTFQELLDIEFLDLGGGFPAPYGRPGAAEVPPLGAPLEEALDHSFPGWRMMRPQVAFESGRALVGSSGTLVCRVTDVKESGGTRFVIVDSGINHLGGMFGLRRLLRPTLEVIDVDGRDPVGAAVVAGPLCTPLDSWGTQELPNVSVGDLLAVRGVGAYGLTASLLGFLSHDVPTEVVARRGDIVYARRVALNGEAAVSS